LGRAISDVLERNSKIPFGEELQEGKAKAKAKAKATGNAGVLRYGRAVKIAGGVSRPEFSRTTNRWF
jgi:hypothetical protein